MERRNLVVVGIVCVAIVIAGASLPAQAQESPTIINLGTGAHPQMIAISQDGNSAYVANEGTSTVSVINIPTATVTRTVNVAFGPYGVALTPDGSKLIVGGNSAVSVVRVSDWTVQNVDMPVCAADWGGVSGITITSDGGTAVMGCRTKKVVTSIDLPTLNVGPSFDVDQGPKGIALGSDETIAYVVAQGNSSLDKVRWTTQTVLARLDLGDILTFPWPEYPSGDSCWIALNPAKTKAYVTGMRSGTVTVVDLSSFAIERTYSLGGSTGPFGIAVTPDGTKLHVALYGSDQLAVIDLSTHQITYRSASGTDPVGIAITPSGAKTLLSNANSDAVSIFSDLASGGSTPGWGWIALTGGIILIPVVAVAMRARRKGRATTNGGRNGRTSSRPPR